jgi:hypothetical protein
MGMASPLALVHSATASAQALLYVPNIEIGDNEKVQKPNDA